MFWTKDGKIIVDDAGNWIDCDHCPCEEENVFCCKGLKLTVENEYFSSAYTDQPSGLSADISFWDIASDPELGEYPRSYDFMIDAKSVKPPAHGATRWYATGVYNYTYDGYQLRATYNISAHWDNKKEEWSCSGTIEEGGNRETGFYDSSDSGNDNPERFKVWDTTIIAGEIKPPEKNAYQQSLPKELQ